jgi:hypothetical protein
VRKYLTLLTFHQFVLDCRCGIDHWVWGLHTC